MLNNKGEKQKEARKGGDACICARTDQSGMEEKENE